MSALRQRSQKSGSAAWGRWCFLHSGWLQHRRSCEKGMPVGLARFASAGSSCTVYSRSEPWPRMVARLHSAFGVSCTSMSVPTSNLFCSSSAGRSLACFISPKSSSSSAITPPLLAAWWLSRRCRFALADWPPPPSPPSVALRFLSLAVLRAAGCIEMATWAGPGPGPGSGSGSGSGSGPGSGPGSDGKRGLGLGLGRGRRKGAPPSSSRGPP